MDAQASVGDFVQLFVPMGKQFQVCTPAKFSAFLKPVDVSNFAWPHRRLRFCCSAVQVCACAAVDFLGSRMLPVQVHGPYRNSNLLHG